MRTCGRIRSRCSPPRRSPTTSMRGSRHGSATISIASSTAAPISRWSARAPGACRAGSMPTPCTPPRSALIGKHDFTTFRSTECQAKSPVKTLDRLDVTRRWRRGAHRDLRALVPAQSGALDGRLAGAGRRRQVERRDDLARVLAARDRAACGPVAPPEGLYLVQRGLSDGSEIPFQNAPVDRGQRHEIGDRDVLVDLVHLSGRPGRTRSPGNSP